jgi:hypothetical protein
MMRITSATATVRAKHFLHAPTYCAVRAAGAVPAGAPTAAPLAFVREFFTVAKWRLRPWRKESR